MPLETLVAPPPAGQYHSSAQVQVARLLGDVTAADGWDYGAVDSSGKTMDTAKIIAKPGGGYLAVYHCLVSTVFEVRVADSTNLATWTYRATLGTHESQPAIAVLPDGGFLVPVEADNNGIQSPSATWIRFHYYTSLANLLAGTAARTLDTEHTLVGPISGGGAEGTPHVYRVVSYTDIDHSIFDIGCHYFMGAVTDRQARGTLTNWSSWSMRTEPLIDTAVARQGAAGKVGDRDSLTWGDSTLVIVEAQTVQNDNATWQPYLYDWQTGQAVRLSVKTHGGSTGFANSTMTLLPGPVSGTVLLATHFIFGAAAAPGESNSLIYYRTVS
jgi:hypothetical protein